MYPSNEDIKIGMKVLVELKKDRGTGKLTEGIVKEKISTVCTYADTWNCSGC